jgi:hypothetical protein
MKKLAFLIVVVLSSSILFAQEKVVKNMDAVKIKKTDVPNPIIQQAEKDFPNASPFQYFSVGETAVSKDWKISEDVNFKENEKIDHYSIEMKGNKSHYEALYDANGKLLMSKQFEKDVALPPAVMQAVNKEYPGVQLKKDEHSKVIDHGQKKEYYVVRLANGKKLTYTPDGTLKK